jgi:hypothetical protein
MMAGIVILFLLIFTSLGDSLAASGQLYLDHEESAAAQLQLAGAKTSSSGNESLSLPPKQAVITFDSHTVSLQLQMYV